MQYLNVLDQHNASKLHCFIEHNGLITYTQRICGHIFHKAVPVYDTGYSDLLDGTPLQKLKDMLCSASKYRITTKRSFRQRLQFTIYAPQWLRKAYHINP